MRAYLVTVSGDLAHIYPVEILIESLLRVRVVGDKHLQRRELVVVGRAVVPAGVSNKPSTLNTTSPLHLRVVQVSGSCTYLDRGTTLLSMW